MFDVMVTAAAPSLREVEPPHVASLLGSSEPPSDVILSLLALGFEEHLLGGAELHQVARYI